MKSLFGTMVLDKNANEIGKIDDVEFNSQDGTIDSIIVSLKRNIISNDEYITISYDSIATIGQYIILNKDFNEKNESKKVTID